jgi:hypothetical protein
MTESTNEQILTDLVECLRDQITELTLRLDEANALNKRLVQSLMTISGVTGPMLDGWDKLNSATKAIFIEDILSLVDNYDDVTR